MAESGELQAFHTRFNDTLQAIEGGYIRVMDQLDRALSQIGEAENDIYEDMRESEGLERLKIHGDSSVVDLLSLSGDTAMENYLLVSGVAQSKDEGSQVVRAASQLKQLIGARAAVMRAKVQVQQEMIQKVCSDDEVAEQDLREF